MKAKSLWYVEPGKAELREHELVTANGAVRVRALFGAISRGTERLVFGGRVPPSEYQRMRAPCMDGHFPFPVKYGYATVGLVEEGPRELVGRTVFTLHPHQSAFTLPAEAVIPIPDRIPPARAVLAANMETALNAMWDAAPGPADRICVVGGGILGLLVGRLCTGLRGASVSVVDVVPERANVATALGMSFSLPATAPGECDVVFHASATPAGLATALGLGGEEATVLELSWYGSGDVPVPLGSDFHSRRLRLVSSQVGKVAPTHRPRWSHRRRLEAALRLLDDPELDVLLAPAVSFDELPEKLPDIFSQEGSALCPLIRYPDADERG